MGHTMSIHSQNDQIILEFGLHKPAFRIVVNSPTTHGSVGLSTGLDPAMTLGCGGYGGNITSDNISPRHLLNIKRVAYELTPVVSRWDRASGVSPSRAAGPALPAIAARPVAPAGIGAEVLSRRIDDFLVARGFKAEQGPIGSNGPGGSGRSGESGGSGGPSGSGGSEKAASPRDAKVLDFVCEEDVRLAIQAGRKLVVSEHAIVTPAARDLGEANRIFSVAPWRG
jgi:hypothetical protein